MPESMIPGRWYYWRCDQCGAEHWSKVRVQHLVRKHLDGNEPIECDVCGEDAKPTRQDSGPALLSEHPIPPAQRDEAILDALVTLANGVLEIRDILKDK